MTDATAPVSAVKTRSTLRLILWLQLVIAGVLVALDIGPALPQLLAPTRAPELTQPVAPGDQVRRFDDRPSRDALPFDIPSDMPSRLTFETRDIDGVRAMLVTGSIRDGDAARFQQEAELLSGIEAVALHSPGGSVRDAIEIGKSVRAREWDTLMTPGTVCLSACPYIFVSGVARTAQENTAIGVHQHYFGENTMAPAFLAVESVQAGQGEVMAHLIEMGVDPAMMQPALITPPDEIYVFLPEELSTLKIITE